MLRTLMIELMLPAPPSWNRMYRVGKGRIYRASAYKQWLAETYYMIHDRPVEPVTTPIGVRVDAYPLDGRARDVDNYLKAALDGLEYWQIIANDRQVIHLQAHRHLPGAYSTHCIRIQIDDA